MFFISNFMLSYPSHWLSRHIQETIISVNVQFVTECTEGNLNKNGMVPI